MVEGLQMTGGGGGGGEGVWSLHVGVEACLWGRGVGEGGQHGGALEMTGRGGARGLEWHVGVEAYLWGGVCVREVSIVKVEMTRV